MVLTLKKGIGLSDRLTCDDQLKKYIGITAIKDINTVNKQGDKTKFELRDIICLKPSLKVVSR